MEQQLYRSVLALQNFRQTICGLLSGIASEVEAAFLLKGEDGFQQQQSEDSILAPSDYSPKFFLLPREVRDLIYKYALTKPGRIYAQRLRLPRMDDSRGPVCAGLVLANRQLNSEATSLLYSENMFFFHAPQDLIVFLAAIGERNRSFVKRIGVMVDCTGTEPLFPIRFLPPRPACLWLRTLAASQLKGVVEMEVQGYNEKFYEKAPMSSELEMTIQDTLGYGDDKKMVRKLSLNGFGQDERRQFPEDWEVVIDPGDFSQYGI